MRKLFHGPFVIYSGCLPMNYYQSDITTIYKQLNTLPDIGLSDGEARARLNKHGENRIGKTNKRNIVEVFFEQFSNLLVLMLIIAAVFSFFLGSYRDAVILLTVVLFNAIVGFYQDWKSENILASIKDLVIDSPLMNNLLHLGPLRFNDWLYILTGGFVYLLIFESIKLLARTTNIISEHKNLAHGS